MSHRSDSPTWTHNRAVGTHGERLVERLIRIKWSDVLRVERIPSDIISQREGDLLITHANGLVWTCEVKRDTRSRDTGRLAIEQARMMGPAFIGTGLTTSTARAWAFVIHDRVIFALPDQLRELIAAKRMDGTLREERVGDGKKTLCALVPILEVEALSGSCVVRLEGDA